VINYRVIAAADLDQSLIRRWADIQENTPVYASPYFRPEFAEAVGQVRDDLRVCVLEDGNRVVGFFPFHRRWGGIAWPAGLGLSDHHAVIAEPGAEWTAEGLMRACGVVRWAFDHLMTGQPQMQPWIRTVEPSPVIDTSGMFDEYIDARRKPLEVALRRQRKLERELGPYRFEFRSMDASLLDTVIRWKSEQCRRTGVTDFLALGWTVELLRRLHALRSENFSGVLSSLWAGDKLLALHFGLRSREVLHYWFPVYDSAYGRYSPGLVLLLELVRQACEDETRYIDLGKDLSQYKAKFMTGSVMVAEGVATQPSLVNGFYALRERVEGFGKNSALRFLLWIPGRLVRQIERRGRYQ
jgi:CelD/BcsL family acetyltransferase involved in cellulose biosynthesis